MNLVQLEYALALKKFGSYSRAAQSVGISQPAMSIQVKKLEENVGFNLFDRSQKKVVPTQEGELFLDRAQLLVLQAKQLKDYARELSEEYTGELKIGIIPTLAPYLLPLFIEELNEQFSKLQVYVKEAITEEIVQGIKSGDLDGGIISTPIGSKVQFVAKPLFYEGFLLFVSEQHTLYSKGEVAVRDIPLKDLWLLREGNCFRDQVNNICELASKEESKQLFFFESNSIESLCRIVEHKGGITFLPELTSLHVNSEREEMIKELTGPKHVREISMIHLPKHVREGHINQLSDVIRKSVPKKMLSKGNYKPIPTRIDL